MKKIKVIVLTLSLVFANLASAAGVIAELVLKPADEVVQVLVKKYKFDRTQAEVLASTITKGAKVALRKEVPATEEALIKALEDRGYKELSSFLKSIEDAEKLSDSQLAQLNDEFGVAVSKTAKAADLCETCGIDEVLLKRLGIKYYIPVSTDIPDSLFIGSHRSVSQKVKFISGARNVDKKSVTRMSLLNAMSSKSENPLSDIDLDKIVVGLEAAEGKHGKEAQAYALAALELGKGDVIKDSRLIATVASLVDDTQDGKSVMKEMSEVMDGINKKHASIPQRRKALCTHYKNKAAKTSTQVDDIALKNLKQCPNFAAIFGAC